VGISIKWRFAPSKFEPEIYVHEARRLVDCVKMKKQQAEASFTVVEKRRGHE
jgi:hypothetical protein